jgi:16S rRNA (uracil1498-N3)-methyltransferase
MLDRYFAHQPIAGEAARLADEEAHHMIHVMRARPGDDVLLFDGSGAEWLARVVQIGRSQVDLQLLQRHEIDRELPIDVALAVALPKGDRQRWLVEKAVELGVRRLIPLITEHGVAQPVDKALLRLRRTVIEASKQCGRNRLMEIGVPLAAIDYFSSPCATGSLRVMADPGGHEGLRSLLDRRGKPLRSIFFAVGPEGGFAADEAAAAESHGWSIVELGPRILRIETAAVALAAAAAMETSASSPPKNGSH